MKLYIYILLGLFAFSKLGISQSANKSASYTELRHHFEAKELSTKQLSAFDTRAQQKLTDFLSLVEFYNEQQDTSMATYFVETVNANFIETATVYFATMTPAEKAPIAEFTRLLVSKDIQMDVSGTSVLPNSNLNKVNRDTYAGALLLVHENETTSNQTNLLVDYYLLKTEKSFGEEKRSVWEVKLGDIREPRPMSDKPNPNYSGNPGSGY